MNVASAESLFARRRIHDLVHQAQAGHRVLGVERRRAYRGRDLAGRVLLGQRRAADQQRHLHAGVLQIARRHHHLLRAFTSRPDSPIASGLCSRYALISSSGGTLMPRLITL